MKRWCNNHLFFFFVLKKVEIVCHFKEKQYLCKPIIINKFIKDSFLAT